MEQPAFGIPLGAAAPALRSRNERVKSTRRGTARGLVLGVISIVLWLGAWQLASTLRLNLLFRFENVPPPTAVVRAAAELFAAPKFADHVVSSVRRVLAGFSLAALLAIGSGLLIGRFRTARQLLLPPLELMRPIPAVAWIPLAILLFASPEASMIFITFIGAFFPVLLSTIHGVEAIDRRLLNASLTLGAGPFDVYAHVILPGALPSIVTGLSIGMGTSWFSLVTAEMISGQFGIGYYTWEAYTLQQYPHIVLGMVMIGLLGWASSSAIQWCGRRFTPWFKPLARVE